MKVMKIKRTILGFAGICAGLLASSAMSMPILIGVSSDGGQTWIQSDADGRSAQAVFTAITGGFEIELTSLALSTSQPNEMLAGLIFGFVDGQDPLLLNPSTDSLQNVTAAALGNAGTSLPDEYDGDDFGLNMDGEWGFRNDLDGLSGGLGAYGISGAAYDPLEISSVIDASFAYAPPVSTSGADFAIAGGDTSGLVASIDFWVINSVTIEFLTVGTFDYRSLEQVNFLYGSDYAPVTLTEPGTLALWGIGLAGMGFVRRRKKV